MSKTTTWRDDSVHTWATYRAATDSASSVSMADGPSIHGLPWTPYDPGEPACVVVLLIDQQTASVTAVTRACRMADALSATLHVVLAIPAGTSDTHPTLLVAHVANLLRALAPRRGHELEVVDGSLEEVGCEIARDESAALVVVDARFGAANACRLTDRLGAPVLVARDARADGDWIAATNMRHLAFPVLSTARELARADDRDVVFFHNARPTPLFVADPTGSATNYVGMLALHDDVAAATRARLARLAGVDQRVHSVVTRAGDTLDALLALARERDADMVVVGHASRTWLHRLLGRGTTERVIEQTRRSVLIVPLAEKR